MNETQNPQWLPLMDYSMKTGVSLSTLRRHIKAGKIEYRRHEGKYLIKLDANAARPSAPASAAPAAPAATKTFALSSTDDYSAIKSQLRKAQEEIAELKTLLACYEEREG